MGRFGSTLDRVLDKSAAAWNMETQTSDDSLPELEFTQHARDFASACTSLFRHMVDGATCGTYHQAMLHLSGFKRDQLLMRIRSCDENDWVPTVFQR